MAYCRALTNYHYHLKVELRYKRTCLYKACGTILQYSCSCVVCTKVYLFDADSGCKEGL